MRADKSELKHHPDDGKHLEDRGDLAAPTRVDVDLAVQEVEPEAARDDHHVPRDHQHREPERELVAPVGEGKGKQTGEEQALVGDGIEKRAQAGALVVVPGDVTIHAVADRGHDEDEDGRVAQTFVRCVLDHTLAVVHTQQHEHRDEQQSDDGDFVRGGHGGARGGRTT